MITNVNRSGNVIQLVDKLNSLARTCTTAELNNYKLLLGLAAGGLVVDDEIPSEAQKAEAFQVILRSLDFIQPSGVVWRGYPNFVTQEFLRQLRAEATTARNTAIRHDQHFLGFGGKIANEFACSQELASFVRMHVNEKMKPTGIASYLWYEEVGDGISPHVDTDIFTLNAILMLDHQYISEPSRLLIYPIDRPREAVQLSPGEMLLIYAGGTIHAREKIKAGEKVNILTIGFQPGD